MNQNSIILQGLTREELRSDILEIISKCMGGITKNTHSYSAFIDGEEIRFDCEENQKRLFSQETKKSLNNDKYLTRREVTQLLKISLPTLHRYTKDGVLRSYRIGGKVRYKQHEVETALKERNFGLSKKGGLK